MASLEAWEERQKDRGRGTRPRARSPRNAEPRPRPQTITVDMPGRSFGDWIIAGFGIGIGLFLFWLVVSIPLGILWAVVISAALP